MKVFKILLATVICGFIAISCNKDELNSPVDESSISNELSRTSSAKGNEAPNGAHYNLNIIYYNTHKRSPQCRCRSLNMEEKSKINRRTMLKTTGLAAAGFAISGCTES